MKILKFMFIFKFIYEKENLFKLIFEASIYKFFFYIKYFNKDE
jgi:hypothetical protein